MVARCKVQFRKVVASLYNVEQVLDVWQAHFIFYYRKRESASFIVHEVHSVTEREGERERYREIQRERERDRRK